MKSFCCAVALLVTLAFECSSRADDFAPLVPVKMGATTQTTTDPFYKSLGFQELNALPAAAFLLGDGTEKGAADALSLVNLSGANATSSRFAVAGERFKEGVRVEIPTDPKDVDADYWHSFLRADANVSVKEGDVQWLTFYARAVPGTAKDEQGRFYFAVKQEKETNGTSISAQGSGKVGTKWQQFLVPFAARSDDKPRLEIYCNFRQQTLEFGGLAWLHFGSSLTVDRLPATKVDLNYRGRKANAAWRVAAQKRIEQIRKGDLQILVVDAKGKPVPNAKISATMVRHAFPFGSHVPTHNFPATDGGGYTGPDFISRSLDDGPLGQQYRAKVAENFNIVTMGFGWRYWADEARFRPAVLKAMDGWNRAGLLVKNHCILYPRENLVPDEILKMSAPDARKALFDYVDAMVPATKNRVSRWDVLNEPFGSLVCSAKFGDDRDAYYQLLADLYKEVKRLDPKSKLFLNDAGQDTSAEQRDKFRSFANELLRRGAPIDGFGVQAHVSVMAPPEEVLKNFDELSKNGQQIGVSEFDVKIGDKTTPETQAYGADVMRDYLTLAFSHPKVEHFILWGFWQGDHWLGNAPIYNLDWTLKPSGQVWRKLIYGDWWTRANGVSNARGAFTTRAFFGDYDLQVSAQGKTARAKIAFPSSKKTVTVVLK